MADVAVPDDRVRRRKGVVGARAEKRERAIPAEGGLASANKTEGKEDAKTHLNRHNNFDGEVKRKSGLEDERIEEGRTRKVETCLSACSATDTDSEIDDGQKDTPAQTEYTAYELANISPTPPLPPVSKAQFIQALDKFRECTPQNDKVPPPVLAARIRELLDCLDSIMEQLSLRITNKLFDALSQPACLAMLLFLLSDISARSTPVMKDIRKSYRYPYLIANIFANGSQAIRDPFVQSQQLVSHLLSFLDGEVPLSTGLERQTPPPSPLIARQDPIIVGNIVQILVSYMETTPEAMLSTFAARAEFLPSVVNLLDVGSVPQLFAALIPDRCVQHVAGMDPGTLSFDQSMTNALSLLSTSRIYHHLADTFIDSTQTIFSVVTNSNPTSDQLQALTSSEKRAYNVTQVYSKLVAKTIRAVRINPTMNACQYLNLFANHETALTLSQIVRAGTELFRGTDGKHVTILDNSLSLAIEIMQHVEEDRERRIASVAGQPALLDMKALEIEFSAILRTLMSVLIDCVTTGSSHAAIRLHIVELFVVCSRVFPDGLVPLFDKLQFGAVAIKIMLRNPRNSLMHHVVCRAVETALISPQATPASARHWLLRSRLVHRILKVWDNENGDAIWKNSCSMQEAPFLSGIVQLACCVQHYFVMHKKHGTSPVQIPEALAVRFENFCIKSLQPILSLETILCGPKPRRKANMSGMSGGVMGRSFGSTGGIRSRSNNVAGGRGTHLVASPSAHRFGFNPPMSSLRSRFDEVFVEAREEEFDRCSSLSSVFGGGELADSLG